MANCPNCGAPLSKDGVCAACGFTNASPEDVSKLLKNSKFAEASIFVNDALNKDPNDGKACLDMVRILTKNFSEKPQDKEQCLDYAVRGLSYASDKDKADVEFKLLAYFENLHLGGRGVENVFDLKASVLGGAAVYDAGTTSKPSLGMGAAPASKAAPANSGKKAGKFVSKLKKPMSKKKSIIVALVTLLVLGGIFAGVVVAVTNSFNKGNNSKKDTSGSSERLGTTFILHKEGGSGGDSSVFVYFNERVPSVEIPYKDGYTFKGYYNAQDGTGTQYFTENGNRSTQISSVWYRDTSDIDSLDLYAYWVASSTKGYTVDLNYGTYKWTYNSSTKEYTSYSGLADNNNSDMKITVSGSCTISFDYDVSSESGYDYFQIYKNGTSTRLNQYSGTASGKFSATLTSSDYLILRYHKDSSNFSGRDNVIVSNIVVG